MMALVSFFVSLTTDNRNRCLNVKKPRFSWDFFFRLSDKTRKETDPWFAIDPGFSVLIPYEPRKGRFLPFLCSSIGSASKTEKTAAIKKVAVIKKQLKELEDYEKDLFDVASKKFEIDLDNGVKHNYPLFGSVLRKIPGLQILDS